MTLYKVRNLGWCDHQNSLAGTFRYRTYGWML